MIQFWQGLPPRSRFGLGAGAALVAALTLALAAWAMRTDYQILFADLASADAAAMVAEIEKMKVPYQLANDGGTILVPADVVHNTRLKLVSKELPLHGTVGLELFNNSEIGMTEFAQKVNYQRAQQGELTRTILAIESVQSARVHLAIPEQTLFRKSSAQPKASVSLVLKPGRRLEDVQVRGIQRLVAAAVADIRAEDVTVLDQHGVALTRPANDTGGADAAQALESKREIEQYLARKLADVLDRTLGAGQSVASIDLELNHDRSRITTENVLPGQGGGDGAPSGVVVREKQSVRDAPGRQDAEAVVTNSESDYQVGRRVEQVVAASGTIRRLNVAVVVGKPLSEGQIERIREVVALAVGYDKARGDGIAVHTIDQFAGAQPAQGAPAAAPADGAPPAVPVPAVAEAPAARTPIVLAVLFGVAALTAFALLLRGRRRASQAPRQLGGDERMRLLAQVNGWMEPSREPAAEARR